MGMPTWDIIGITSHGLYWTVVETNVALIACCLPTLRPILSMAAFGTVLASFGSFLQGLGSKMGSSKGTTQNSTGSSGTGKFSKFSAASKSSVSKKKKRNNDSLDDTASDVSLVELEKSNGVRVAHGVAVSHENYNAFDLELEEKKYSGNDARTSAV